MAMRAQILNSKPFVGVLREGFGFTPALAFIAVRGMLCWSVLVLFRVVISVVCRGRCCTAILYCLSLIMPKDGFGSACSLGFVNVLLVLK